LREIILLQRIYGRVSLNEFGKFLKEFCKGLEISLIDLKVVEGWVKASISGEDEDVAGLFLGKEFGVAPVSIQKASDFSVFRGRVTSSRHSKLKLFLDVGIFLPKPVHAIIPLQCLQGQLVDGKKFALKRLMELFGLVDKFPLEVRALGTSAGELSTELTVDQLSFYRRWIDSRVDRLIVLGALKQEVEESVKRARLTRDILRVESLGVLEHAVVCKLGTNVVGLVPKFGKLLAGTKFSCFSPRRILKLTEGRW
jgi:hypothetical protein